MRTLMILAAACLLLYSCTPPTDQNTADVAAEAAKPAPLEFADNHFVALAEEGLQAMVNQDHEAFVARFTDDALYIFNSGDTISGKAAITTYWKDRMDVIETIEFSNNVWLPVKVNESEDVALGNWLLAWFDVNASYISGGEMSQAIHTLYHFTPNDEIDVVIQYIDRYSIMQAQAPQE